jgi:hypothetical protein
MRRLRTRGLLRYVATQHATLHWRSTGHPVVQNFEPDEEWFWNYQTQEAFADPGLAPPCHHPLSSQFPDRVAEFPLTGNSTFICAWLRRSRPAGITRIR